MKKMYQKLIRLILICALLTVSSAPFSVDAKNIYKEKSQIDGTTMTCSANGSVSKILKTEAYGAWESKPSVFIPNIAIWSDGAAVSSQLSQEMDGKFTQYCHFYGDKEAMASLIRDYLNLLEKYGFSCTDTNSSTVMGYEYMTTKKLTYTGSENITKNMCQDYEGDSYDAEITYFKDSYKDSAFVSITMPKEIGVKDTGERRSGKNASAGQSVSINTVKSDQSFFLKWGEYDVYKIYAFGNSEDYIDIKLKPGTYKAGSKYSYSDFKNLKGVSYSILSHEIVEDDIYNYISPTDNTRMIKDFQVKVLKADKNVHALYYYITVCDQHAYNYVLEGVIVSDKNVKRTVNINFKSNGKTKKLNNNASVTAKNGTTYKIKKGSTITFKSPTSSSGFSYYVYSFYADKNGIVDTSHPYITSPSATITAKKKGTIYYKIGFTGSKKVTKVNRIKVPGTSSTYTTSTYQVYENTLKDQIIKIVIY